MPMDKDGHMIPRMIVAHMGDDEWHVVLEVAINLTAYTRHTLDIVDTEDQAYSRAREFIDFISAIWSE
jgi:hypothetical protein